MDNQFIILDISKKNNIPLNRKSSLDSTKSSIRVKKIKLHNELSPFVKITQNTNIKNVLDFPICMSLFTNNYSLSEKDKMSNNSNNRIKFKYPNIKNNVLNENKKNELLLLSKEKKIISRNPNVLNIHSFSPINSIVKSSILNQKLSFQSSRNLSKPILKKIEYSPLTNLTKQTNNSLRLLKKYNYFQKNSGISNNTLEQEISSIKKEKNYSILDLKKYNIDIKKINKLKIPLKFFTTKDNGAKEEKEKIGSPKKIINKIQNEATFSETNSIMSKINSTNNKLFKVQFNQMENLNNNYDSNKSLLEDKSDKSIIFNKNKNIKNNKKSKINKLREKINKSENIDSNNKLEKNSINKTNKKTVTISSNNKKDDKKNSKNIDKKDAKFRTILMIGKEKLEKLKNNKLYLVINNKKTNEIYSKRILLNEYNKIITEKSINNAVNTKIFLQKSEMLVNFRESIKNFVNKQESKLKQIETSPLSKEILEKIMLIYNKNIFNNKKKIEQYKKIVLSMRKIKFHYKIIIYKMNCKLTEEEKTFLFSRVELGELNISILQEKKKLRRQSVQNITINNDFKKNIKRKNTFSQNNKIIFNELDDGFLLRKTKNYFKKEIKWRNNPANLMTIHGYILKSLNFNNEEKELKIDYTNSNDTIPSPQSPQKINFRIKARELTKKFVTNFRKKSSKILLKKFKKKNSASFKQNELENEIPYNNSYRRRSTTVFSIDDLTKTIKKQISKKSPDSPINNFSILKRKNFFIQTRIIKENNKELQKSINLRENYRDSVELTKFKINPENLNSEHINMNELYFELIKFLIEGKNKQFQKLYEKNRLFIDINQELFDGNTLLILSAREGNYFIAKFLCEQNAKVNNQNKYGNTALHYAIGKQFYAIADILARYGAREDIKNIKGLSPWDCIENNIE